MLSIGQLAAYLGLTVRAIRYYHQRGLLPEPERDASGYRRYDADAVLALIRIRTLSDAGVPLSRIEELLGAGPERFAQAIDEIDESLSVRINELERQRTKIAGLVGGERLFLAAEIVDYLDRLRELQVSPRMVQMERDAWILLTAKFPEQVPRWAVEKQAALAEPEFRELYLACGQALDWDPDDPRLVELAEAMVAYARRRRSASGRDREFQIVDDPIVLALVQHPGQPIPSWERLVRLCTERLKDVSPL